MKNWLRFVSGVWINGKDWEEREIVYVDPAAVVMVAETDCPRGSIIQTTATLFAVRESATEIIAQIQSALP